MKKRLIPLLFAALAACVLLSLCAGRFEVPLSELLKILFKPLLFAGQTDGQAERVVFSIRLPRVLAAALIGAGLSAAGCVYQGIFKNPLASPDVLGSSAGSGFGAALAIYLSLGYAGIVLSSFVMGLGALLGVYFLSRRFRGTLGMILAGIMAGSLFTAATSYLKLIADPSDQLPAITYWLMGSLASIRLKDLPALFFALALGAVPLFAISYQLNAMTLDDFDARSLGVNVKRTRTAAIICCTLMTSACVAVSGFIGWVGLAIPHLARRLVGNDYKRLLGASMLMGAVFLVAVDTAARTIAVMEIPIGILTAFVGAPLFLWLFFQKRREA